MIKIFVLVLRIRHLTHSCILRHPWLRYQVTGYTEYIVHNYEQRLETIWDRSVNRVHILNFEGLTPKMRQDLAVRLRMVYAGGDGLQPFVSHAWRRLFGIRGPLARKFILEFLSTCRMSDTEMGLDVSRLHTEEEIGQAGFGAYWSGNERFVPDKGDMRDYWIEISSDRDILGATPSYVHIRDPDYGSGDCQRPAFVSLVYIQACQGEEERGKLLVIDLHELARINIYGRFGDTWAWVAPGPEMQPVAAADAPEADEDAPDAAEGAQADPAHAHAPPPDPQPRTMSQRIERVEEEMRDLRHDVLGLRGVVESFTTEQSRVSTWLISCMTQLMDASGHTYQAFDSTLVGSSRMPY
ncbi:hypothetical protein Tco_1000648 [Tanacetum coccineum]